MQVAGSHDHVIQVSLMNPVLSLDIQKYARKVGGNESSGY